MEFVKGVFSFWHHVTRSGSPNLFLKLPRPQASKTKPGIAGSILTSICVYIYIHILIYVYVYSKNITFQPAPIRGKFTDNQDF